MSQQRVPFEVRDEALSGLRDWWSDRLDFSFFNQVCGYLPQSDTRYSGNQAVIAASSNNIYRADTSAVGDDSITTTATFTLKLIDSAIERARTLTPAIRPVLVGGKPLYVFFMHPYNVT